MFIINLKNNSLSIFYFILICLSQISFYYLFIENQVL